MNIQGAPPSCRRPPFWSLRRPGVELLRDACSRSPKVFVAYGVSDCTCFLAFERWLSSPVVVFWHCTRGTPLAIVFKKLTNIAPSGFNSTNDLIISFSVLYAECNKIFLTWQSLNILLGICNSKSIEVHIHIRIEIYHYVASTLLHRLGSLIEILL